MLDIDLFPFCVTIYKKVNDDFILIDLNKKITEIENIKKDDVLGCKLTQIYPDAKESGFFDAMLLVDKTGKSKLLDVVPSINKQIDIYRKNEIVKLPNGLIANFFTDTSEKKKLENLFEKQRNIFQNLMLDSKVISIQGYNEYHEVIYWNHASEKIYGYSAEEAMGKKLEDLIIPKNMQKMVYYGVENWIKNGVEIPSSELILVDKYKNEVHVYSQHKMLQISANKYEMYCIDIDLNSTKKLQKELLSQRNFLRTVYDVIPDIMWVKSPDGKYLSCNRKFEEYFNLSEKDIIGKTDFDFLDYDTANKFVENDKLVIQNSGPLIMEEHLEFPDKHYVGDFETIKTVLKDSDNKIIGILGIARDITDRKSSEQRLLTFASTDILTGISNRAILMDRLEQLVKRRDSKDRHGAVLFIDLDNFKNINDEKGHHIGDEVLIEIANRLSMLVRRGDTVSRLGGDEFVLILEKVIVPKDASFVAEKALDLLKKPIFLHEYKLSVSASIGISIFPNDGNSTELLLSHADKAMYYAKKHGKNRYIFYADIKDHP